MTGGMHDWAGSMGIASFTPELWNGDDSDTEINHSAVHAVLDDAEALFTLPEDRVERNIVVPAALWRFWRSRGGAALFGYPLASVQWINGRLVQYFERVVIELNPQAADTQDFVRLAPIELSEQGYSQSPDGIVSPDIQGRLIAFWVQRRGESLFGGAHFVAAIDPRSGVVTQRFARVELVYDPATPDEGVHLTPLGWQAWHRQQILAPTLLHQIR